MARRRYTTKKDEVDWIGAGIFGLSAAVLSTILVAATIYGKPNRASEPNVTPVVTLISRGTPIGQGAIVCPPDQEPASTPRIALIPTPAPTETPTPEGYIKPKATLGRSPSYVPPQTLEVEHKIVTIKCYPAHLVPSSSSSPRLSFFTEAHHF